MATTTVRQRDLQKKLRDPGFAERFTNALSPGPAGARLGIGRHGIYQLLLRGRLDSIRLVSDRSPHRLLALLIPEDSLESFRKTRYQRETA